MASKPTKDAAETPTRASTAPVAQPDISGIPHPDFTDAQVHARAREAIRRMHRRNLERAGRKV